MVREVTLGFVVFTTGILFAQTSACNSYGVKTCLIPIRSVDISSVISAGKPLVDVLCDEFVKAGECVKRPLTDCPASVTSQWSSVHYTFTLICQPSQRTLYPKFLACERDYPSIQSGVSECRQTHLHRLRMGGGCNVLYDLHSCGCAIYREMCEPEAASFGCDYLSASLTLSFQQLECTPPPSQKDALTAGGSQVASLSILMSVALLAVLSLTLP